MFIQKLAYWPAFGGRERRLRDPPAGIGMQRQSGRFTRWATLKLILSTIGPAACGSKEQFSGEYEEHVQGIALPRFGHRINRQLFACFWAMYRHTSYPLCTRADIPIMSIKLRPKGYLFFQGCLILLIKRSLPRSFAELKKLRKQAAQYMPQFSPKH